MVSRKHCFLLTVIALLFMQKAFGEDLLSIYSQAVQSDPSLRAAELKVKVASAQKGQALGQLLPQISGVANWSLNHQSFPEVDRDSSYKGARFYVSLTQSLIDFSKFWDWQRTKEVENQNVIALTAAQQELIYFVVERYFAVLDAEDQLELSNLQEQSTQTQLEQVKRQYAKQLVKITDVYEIEAELDLIGADKILAESRLLIAQQALQELTNARHKQLKKLKEGMVFTELQGQLNDWLAVAKAQNPMLAAQFQAIEAAKDNVAVQKSRFFPVVALQLNYYDTDTGYQSARTAHTQTQVAAINVNVPIFTGGTTTHRLHEAQSKLGLAEQETESQMRALLKETSDAFSTSNAYARRINASQKALFSAVKSREAMQKGLQYGVETVADVLRAQQLEFRAKRDLVRAKYLYITNRIRFLKAIGSLSPDNLKEINDWLI